MFHKFNDGKVEMVVVVYVNDILAYAENQATMERFAAELGGKFKVESMVEKFDVERASRTPSCSGVSTLSKRMSRKARRNIC